MNTETAMNTETENTENVQEPSPEIIIIKKVTKPKQKNPPPPPHLLPPQPPPPLPLNPKYALFVVKQ